jgi:hypothetical protein
MSNSLSATFKASVFYDFANTDTLGITTDDQNTDSYSLSTSNGTGANGTADLKYSAKYTINGNQSQDIDLAGNLTDRFGATITFARIKCLHVRVLGTADDSASTGGPVDVGGGTAGAQFVNWISVNTAKVRVGGSAGRKGCLHLSCDDATAYAVTATTGDILRLTNVHATNAVKVAVVLIGSSA